MRRLFFVLAIVGALAAVAATSASASVPRYQMQTGQLTISLEPAYPGNIHVFDITISPCDGSFTGATSAGSPVQLGENITGTIWQGQFDFTSTYSIGLPGYQWFYTGPFSGGQAHDLYLGSELVPGGFFITPSLGTLTDATNWKNHGDFVSHSTDREDAAHSCIGMPITH